LAAITLVFLILLVLGAVAGFAPSRASDEPPEVITTTVTVPSMYRGHTAEHYATKLKRSNRLLASSRSMTHKLIVRKWQPTMMYALRLASAVSGVPLVELAPIAHCESTYNPFARNGKYKGLFQLGWVPFGIFSPFDLVANALSAALTVKADGSWRQWECKP